MREMLKMPSEHLIEQNLVRKDVGFVLNGQSMSVALEGPRVGAVDQEDLQQIQDLQRLYLSSILILTTLELGIWKGTSSHMER